MTRRKKLMLSTVSSLIYQLTTIVCGFILPRFFLTYYGSAVNGLVSSITQFLGFISLCECGVGAVVQSALYEPLAKMDKIQVSKIVISSERFFRKIAYILLVYTVCLMIFYPFITIKSFDYMYTFVLILVISISSFAQYYFGMTYRLLLNADQLGFCQYFIHTTTLLLNTISCIFLMKNGASVQVVKLVTSLIFLLQPFSMMLIAKRRYKIDRNIILTEEPIKQKWNGLAQHISAVVLGNTDTVVLTLLSTLENVSIYAVYYLVVNGVKQIALSLTNGVQALFGNMLAKNEKDTLNSTFDTFEWAMHTLITLIFTVTAMLILQFVRVYTAKITDANYIVPAFAYLITAANAAYCLRLPYNIMVLAAGHYKQTQSSAIIEALINIILSIVLVFNYGLVGVAIGTLVAMMYRTIYFAIYLSKNITYRDIRHFIKHIIIDIVTVILIVATVKLLPNFFKMSKTNYLSWIILALKTGIFSLIIVAIVNIMFYNRNIKRLVFCMNKKQNKKECI